MKVLKIIGILLLLVIVLALVASLLLPKELEVEREKVIDAPIEVVWSMVSTLDSQSKWSPWQTLDTAMKSEIVGDDGTVGATLTWDSDNEMVGKGEQELTLVDAENRQINSALRFFEPWESVAEAWIKLEETEDGQTKAIWGFRTQTPVFQNLFMTLRNAKGMIADDYDKGLESLNSMSQALALQAELAPKYDVKEEVRGMAEYIGLKQTMSTDSVQAYFNRTSPNFMQYAMNGMVDTTKPAGALYFDWNGETKMTVMTATMSRMGDQIPEGMEVYTIDSGNCLIVDHHGGYGQMMGIHNAIGDYMQENNYYLSGPVLEEYVISPMMESDSNKWHTRVVYPVKKKSE